MTRQMIFPLVLGIVGTAILLSLGTWQVYRMAWKTQILAQIDTRLAADPVPLPDSVSAEHDKYLKVLIDGTILPGELDVLASGNGGPGFKVIAPMTLEDGRTILLDRGFIPESAKDTARAGGLVELVGVLIWPNETDGYVPDPNMEKNIWFARDVARMSAQLHTAPIMVSVIQSTSSDGVVPQAVAINIPNRHLEYVLTWYSLAIIWIGMTVYFLWRIKHQTV